MADWQRGFTKVIRFIAIVGGVAAILIGIAISALCFWLASLKVGLIVSAGFLCFFLLIYLVIYKKAFDRERLLDHGLVAEARVLHVEKTLWNEESPTGSGRIYRFDLEVKPASGVPYQVSVKASRVRSLIEAFHHGIKLSVRIDPKNSQKVLVEKIGDMVFIDKNLIWEDVLYALDFS